MKRLVGVYKKLYGSVREGIGLALEEIERALESGSVPIIFFEAPTGYGKTACAQSLALYPLISPSQFFKVIHVFPLRSLLKDVLTRSRALFSGLVDDPLVKKFVGAESMDYTDSYFLDAPYTLTTVDTFLMSLMKYNPKMAYAMASGRSYGYDIYTQASILTSFVVFDEAHILLDQVTSDDVFNPWSLTAVFLGALQFLSRVGVPMLIMTATLSKTHLKLMKNAVLSDNADGLKIVDITHNNDKLFEKLRKMYSKKVSGRAVLTKENLEITRDSAIEIAKKEAKEGKIVLFVLNTIKSALKVYESLRNEVEDVILLHGKLMKDDRENMEDRLRQFINRNVSGVVVSTQVIEAGVDLDADVLITEMAPMTSLIQRAGRIVRKRPNEDGCIYIVRTEHHYPYNEKIVVETRNVLCERTEEDDLDLHSYDVTTDLLDCIYSKESVSALFPNIIIGSAAKKVMEFPNVRSSIVKTLIQEELKRKGEFIRELMLPSYVGEIKEGKEVSITVSDLRKMLELNIDFYLVNLKKKNNTIIKDSNVKTATKDLRRIISMLIDENCVILIPEDAYIPKRGPKWLTMQ